MPTLPEWFLVNCVATSATLVSTKPWISFKDTSLEGVSEHNTSPRITPSPSAPAPRNLAASTPAPNSPTSTPDAGGEDLYEMNTHIYDNLRTLVSTEVEALSMNSVSRFDHDAIAVRLPGKHKQAQGLDFLASVAKFIARDIGSDYIQLDYDVLQAIEHHFQSGSGTASWSRPGQQPRVRQGIIEWSHSSSARSGKWSDWFHQILSAPRVNSATRNWHKSDAHQDPCVRSKGLVVVFMEAWRETEDASQNCFQEEVRRAFGLSLRGFSTRDYPVVVLATDVPLSLHEVQPCPHSLEPLTPKSSSVDSKHRDRILEQIGRRPLYEPVEICPVPCESQRQLLRRDQVRKDARDNIRRIQLHAKRSSSCGSFTDPRLLEPHCEWEFMRSSPAYEILTRESLPQNQVITMGLQLLSDCSELGVRRVVGNIFAARNCLSDWAETNSEDLDGHKSPESPQSRRIQDVIDRIKADEEEFEWELTLIDSIVETGNLECTWADIDIETSTKSTINRLISHKLHMHPMTQSYGILKSGGVGGVLLYGPPGTGKTHLARIIAKESHATMIHVSYAEVVNKYVGDTEKLIKALFRLGRMLYPSIIFIDEAETLLRVRQKDDPQWLASQVNQFLGEADGLLKRKNSAFLILATNLPQQLDKAVLRRVPAKIYVGPPWAKSREKIFRICLREETLDSSVDLNDLARWTHRYSGSDIKAVCFNAASICQFNLETTAHEMKETDTVPRRVLTMAHFKDALKAIGPSVTESLMQPVSDFAHDHDPSAFATMQAFKEEQDKELFNQLKQSSFGGSSQQGVQVTQQETVAMSPMAAVRGAGHSISRLTPNYKSLDGARNEIRLIELIDAEKLESGEPIRCSLHIVSLLDDPAFTGLSYVWGEPTPTEEVWVDGFPVQVRVNLTAALRWAAVHWQRTFPGRQVSEMRLWADALCINQENISERNHQVAMMGQLYTKAEIVLCTIATQDVQICLAFELYRAIYKLLFSRESRPSVSDLVHRHWLLKIPSLAGSHSHAGGCRGPAWDALNAFSKLPYWRRVWIVQEMFSAQRVLLMCDSESLDFTFISEISSLLNLKELQSTLREAKGVMKDGVSDGGYRSHTLLCDSCYKTIASPAPILKIYEVKKHGGQRDSPAATAEFRISLLEMSTELQATDPHDIVYGLLGLSKLPIDVDYSQEVGTVFAQYLRHWTETFNMKDHQDTQKSQASTAITSCLSIAGLAMWELDGANMPPSWCPNFSSTFAGLRRTTQYRSRRHHFQPTSTWKFSELFGPNHSISVIYPSLHMDGFQIDSVKRATKVESNPDESLHWSTWDHISNFIIRDSTYITGIPRLQAILRVLTGCSAHAALPLGRKHAQELIAISVNVLRKWMAPANEFGVRRQSLRLLDPWFNSPFTSTRWDVSQTYRWLAREACPEYPGLAETIPDSLIDLDDEELKSDLGGTLFELEGGLLGLAEAPCVLLEKDVVCILEGCSCPVILRQAGAHYNFVGTCTVLGLMTWDEVKGTVERGKISPERFQLR